MTTKISTAATTVANQSNNNHAMKISASKGRNEGRSTAAMPSRAKPWAAIRVSSNSILHATANDAKAFSWPLPTTPIIVTKAEL